MRSDPRPRRGSGASPADGGARLRVRRAIDAAELEPPGFPAAAVLVVRALADPLPGSLGGGRAPMRAPEEWERAVRAELTERWRGAARPALGPVPAGAEAVYFSETAEMLAAFARDACAGDPAHWWWRALLRGLPQGPLAALTALWCREARHAPAALELLRSAGQAERVVEALAPSAATRILTAVAVEFDVRALLAAPVEERTPALPRDAAQSAPQLTREPRDHATASLPRPAAPHPPVSTPAGVAPWDGWLPPDAVPPRLLPEAAALLGAGLMLHRAPLVARSRAFADRFVRWRAGAHTPEPPLPLRATAPTPAVRPTRPPGQDAGTAASGPPPASGTADRPGGEPLDPALPSEPGAAAVPGSEPAGGDGLAQTQAAIPPAGEATQRPGRPHSPRGRLPRHEGEAEPRAPEAEPAAPSAPVVFTGGVASGACGVFFLVNVLRSLRFFRQLDDHFELVPAVGGWGWVELIARALLGPGGCRLRHDPVWRVLAELDGRSEQERPGGGFVEPLVDRLPPEWIDLFGGSPPGSAPSPPLGVRAAPPLQRFLDRVVPVVAARAMAALRAAGAPAEATLEEALLRRAGSVEATRTHVDVRMGMEQVTLPARLAGLDANPGWVPELARVVTFHFA